MAIHSLLIFGALICFFLAAIGVSAPRISLTPLGLFLLTLTLVI